MGASSSSGDELGWKEGLVVSGRRAQKRENGGLGRPGRCRAGDSSAERSGNGMSGLALQNVRFSHPLMRIRAVAPATPRRRKA